MRAPRDFFVDLVRSVAVLLVLAVHLHALRLVHGSGVRVWDSFWDVFSAAGPYGVTVFFVVSGYLITRIVDLRYGGLFGIRARDFYLARATRILPLLCLVLLVGVGILGAFWPMAWPGFAFCFRNPSAVFDAAFWVSIPTFTFNWLRLAREVRSFGFGLHWDVLWSLAVEEQFYLLYPLFLLWLGNRERLVWALWTVVAFGPAARAICLAWRPHSFLLPLTNSFGCFDALAIGCLLYLYRGRGRGQALWLCVTGLAIWMATCAVCPLWDWSDRVFGPTLVALGVALFLYGAGETYWPSPVGACLVAPGRFSYGCYLWHATVLFLLSPLLHGMPSASAFALVLVSVTLVGALSAKAFEAPVRDFLLARWSPERGR